MLFFPLINVNMPTIVGILTVMSRKNFMLPRVEHEKSFITSGPEVFSSISAMVSMITIKSGTNLLHFKILTAISFYVSQLHDLVIFCVN